MLVKERPGGIMGTYPPGVGDNDPRAPWNDAEPWEGRTCGECFYCAGVAGCCVCLCDAIGQGYPKVDEVRPDDWACEVFEERGESWL